MSHGLNLFTVMFFFFYLYLVFIFKQKSALFSLIGNNYFLFDVEFGIWKNILDRHAFVVITVMLMRPLSDRSTYHMDVKTRQALVELSIIL